MIIEVPHVSTTAAYEPTVLGWRLPAIGFFVYSMIAVGSHVFDARGLLVIGAGLMFLCVLAASYRSVLLISVDGSVGYVFWILLLAMVATLYDPEHTAPHILLKHSVICVVYILVFSMELRPIYSTPFRRVFIFTLLLMGVISLITPRSTEVDNVSRMSGLFVNSNNLSLILMTLLFLINHERDSRLVKVLFHSVIILFLLLSGTSGAILAYIGAMLFHFLVYLRSVRRSQDRLALVLISIFLILLGCLLPAGFYTGFPIASRIVAQLSVIMEELPLAVSGYEFDYARLSSKYGMSDFSGIWRISHWRTSFDIVAKANTFQLLFGHGIGSANLLLYKLPHNDYLRVLIEQGIVGLTLTAAFFLTLFRRINWKYWHCIVVVGLYCISENNMDNLLFMCIFAFFLASAQNKPLPDPTASIA